jgi:hypothetical protein
VIAFEQRCIVVSLLGNHEEMLLAALDGLGAGQQGSSCSASAATSRESRGTMGGAERRAGNQRSPVRQVA